VLSACASTFDCFINWKLNREEMKKRASSSSVCSEMVMMMTKGSVLFVEITVMRGERTLRYLAMILL
jgi:hypothetical protein